MFIVLEGIDGSGKTTVADGLARLFRKRNLTPVLLEEPTYGQWGSEIRTKLLNPAFGSPVFDLRAQHELFTSDRRDHVNTKIRPLLAFAAEHPWVILIQTRYYLSAAAYQGGGSAIELKSILEEQRRFAPAPDAFVVLDVPPKLAIERLEARGIRDSLERISVLESVRVRYRQLATLDPSLCRLVDGTGSEKEVLSRVVAALQISERRFKL